MSGPRTYTNVWRAFLVAELMSLTLFLVGPCAGSIDSNDDGIPDVPIVVTACGPIARVPRATTASLSAGGPDRPLNDIRVRNLQRGPSLSTCCMAFPRIDLTLLSLLRC
jgi:hypothetical protein